MEIEHVSLIRLLCILYLVAPVQPRVQSRLSLRRVRFEPYSHLQVVGRGQGGRGRGRRERGREEKEDGRREILADFNSPPTTPPASFPPSLLPSLPGCLLQVASILKTRLGGLVPRVIDDQCIQMCSRKVANVSGDLRKAFQVEREGGREGKGEGEREGERERTRNRARIRKSLLSIIMIH